MNQELDKISKFFSTDNIVSNEEMKQALEGIATILKSFTEATSQINKETKQKLDLIVSQVNEEHNRIISEVDSKTSATEQNLLKELQQALTEVNSLKEQVSAIEVQNGVDVQDADEEAIVAKVLQALPKGKDLEPETTESIAEKLNKGKEIIEIKSVKGMEKLIRYVDNMPRSVGGDTSTPLNVYSSSTLVKGGVGKLNFTGATVTYANDVTNVAIAGSGQSAIQPQDEGVNLGASGTVDTINFVGAGVTATRATNTVTVTIPGGGAGSVPTGTGFRAVVAGVENAAAKLVDTADINNSQVTLAKMADVATGTVFYRKTAATGVPEVQTLATLKTDLGLTGTNSGDQTISLTGEVTGSGTGSFATTLLNSAVVGKVLTGLSLATSQVIAATDTVVLAFGYLQAQVTALTTTVAGKVASVTAGTNVTVTGTATAPIVNAPTMTATVGGAVPTPPNIATQFLNGQGIFSTPAGSGDMVLASAQTNSGVKTFLDTTMALRNVANTFSGVFTNAITAARTWTLKDASGTIAFTSDITGTNSGTNTGDQTITLTGGVTGSGTGSFAATVVTNANLTGDVTSVGNATTLTNAPVIAKVLTGYVSGAGTVAATDSILAAIQKLNGNDATNANLTGPITSVGNATSVAAQTGTGSTFVMNTSPTLVTPLLGTPTSGVMTNVTGIAAGLTSGITNALKSATTTVDVSAATAPSTGQVLTATSGTAATWQTPSGGSGTTWTEVTGTSQAAAVSNGYVTNNAALVTVTLPSTATVGQIVYVQGSGAGGWKMAQNASQTIVWDAGAVAGTNITTSGVTGYLASSDRYDSVEVMCITTNTGFVVRNSKGNLSIN